MLTSGGGAFPTGMEAAAELLLDGESLRFGE